VVNGFDRVCGAAIIDNKEIAGISSWKDQGVPYKYEIGYTGSTYDFDRESTWLDDDSPGWGASYGNIEGKSNCQEIVLIFHLFTVKQFWQPDIHLCQ